MCKAIFQAGRPVFGLSYRNSIKRLVDVPQDFLAPQTLRSHTKFTVGQSSSETVKDDDVKTGDSPMLSYKVSGESPDTL
jgi:hypothetical protein